MDKWIDINLLEEYPEATDSMIKEALDMAMEQVKNNLPEFEEHFPADGWLHAGDVGSVSPDG